MAIPFNGLDRQYIILKDELLDATHRALKDGQLVNGPYTRSLEEYLKYKTKIQFAVTVHSGTQALEIIARYKRETHIKKFGIDPIVKIPNLTYPATLNAFLSTGYTVELVDTDKYGIMDLENETVKTPSYFYCMVGLYGRQITSEQIHYVVGYNTIIDGAQHWLVAKDYIGSGMAISFDPTKNLPSSGNGGAIITNNLDLYQYALAFKGNGKFTEYNSIGTNTKMSEQDCSQLLVRAKYLDKWQLRREEISKHYYNELKNLPITILNDQTAPHANQKFVIADYKNRDNLLNYMLDNEIECKVHYDKTLSELGISKNLKKPDFLSKSMMLSKSVLSLPIYPELHDSEVEIVSNTVKTFYSKVRLF